MNVLIVGSEGGQGKRFQAILEHLKVPFGRLDAKYFETAYAVFEAYTHFIIATPTDTHAEVIRELLPYKKPILCEKPITKNIYEMRDLYEEIKRADVPFAMVYQYRHLVDANARLGHSHYNYFRHGNDGLIWDCLQIIGHAQNCIQLEESSPVWKCEINGEPLFIEDMDKAYITEIKEWLAGRGMSDLREILRIHEKVNALAEDKCSQTTTRK